MEILTHQNQLGNIYTCFSDLDKEDAKTMMDMMELLALNGVCWLRDDVHGGVLRPVLDGKSDRRNAMTLLKALYPNRPEMIMLLCRLVTMKWMAVK